MANLLKSSRTEILSAIKAAHSADAALVSGLSLKYPEMQWECIAGFVEGASHKNRLKYWVKASKVDSRYQSEIGVNGWRLATASGVTPIEAIDRVILRMRQFIKDVEFVFSQADETP